MGRTSRLRARLAFTAAVLLVVSVAGPARAADPETYVVDSAGDADGTTCSSPCTLRQALNAANLNAPAHDTIAFAIPGGPADILPGSALPAITDAVTIDGTSQPGTRLVGTEAGADTHGLLVQASGTVIRGIEIREFDGDGVRLDGVHDTTIGGETAGEANTITANGGDGIAVLGDATATGNRLLANSITGNGELSIDHADDDNLGIGGDIGDGDTGPNGFANSPDGIALGAGFPVTEVTVTGNARAFEGTARFELFHSPSCPPAVTLGMYAQAASFLGAVDATMVDTGSSLSTGSAVFTIGAPISSGYLTATITTSEGTSELSGCAVVSPPTDLQVDTVVSPAGSIAVGESMQLDVIVSNLGLFEHPDPIAGAQVALGTADLIAVSSTQGTCVLDSLAAFCFLGPLAGGATTTISIDLAPTSAGELHLAAAVVDLANLDPDLSNNDELVSINVAAEEVAGPSPIGGGGSLSTDTEADGATPSDPIETTVIVPAGAIDATISVSERADAAPPPAGYQFFGQASVISAVVSPPATAAQPLVLRFLLDGSEIPAEPLVVFRNGVPVPACSVADPGTDPSATPDPCVLPSSFVGDDLLVTVRTSQASTWRLGTVLPYAFTGFFSPVDNDDVLNRVKAGAAVPLKFSLDGDRGLAIFAPGSPTSTGIPCGGPVDAVEQTVTAGSSTLQYDPVTDRYAYVWKTEKAWAGTCRQLTMTLADGSIATADFHFVR